MDHDYELEDDYAPRILWGRIAFFVLAVILAFAVGRCTKSAGVSEAAYNEERQKVQELASENTVLQQQLESAAAAGNEGGNGGGGNNDGGGNEDGGEEQATEAAPDEPVGEGERYTVQSGDTLTRIAEQFYDDPRKFDLIVDANNLDSSTSLRVGQELIIPADE